MNPEASGDRVERSAGSGFLVDPSGRVVTSSHFVLGQQVLAVTLDDGTTLPTRVVGADPEKVAAVLSSFQVGATVELSICGAGKVKKVKKVKAKLVERPVLPMDLAGRTAASPVRDVPAGRAFATTRHAFQTASRCRAGVMTGPHAAGLVPSSRSSSSRDVTVPHFASLSPSEGAGGAATERTEAGGAEERAGSRAKTDDGSYLPFANR